MSVPLDWGVMLPTCGEEHNCFRFAIPAEALWAQEPCLAWMILMPAKRYPASPYFGGPILHFFFQPLRA